MATFRYRSPATAFATYDVNVSTFRHLESHAHAQIVSHGFFLLHLIAVD